jgi:hypothetical protein
MHVTVLGMTFRCLYFKQSSWIVAHPVELWLPVTVDVIKRLSSLWTLRRRGNLLASVKNQAPAVQPVICSCTDWVIQAMIKENYNYIQILITMPGITTIKSHHIGEKKLKETILRKEFHSFSSSSSSSSRLPSTGLFPTSTERVLPCSYGPPGTSVSPEFVI